MLITTNLNRNTIEKMLFLNFHRIIDLLIESNMTTLTWNIEANEQLEVQTIEEPLALDQKKMDCSRLFQILSHMDFFFILLTICKMQFV